MSISVDTINLRFNIKPDYDQQKLQQLQEDLQQGQKELENTRKAMDRLSKNGLKAMTKEQREEFDRLSDHLSKTAREVHENEQKMKQFTRTSDISKMSIHQLGQRAKELSAVIKNMNPRTDDFKEYKKELDAVNNRMKELRSTADDTKAALTKFVDGFNKFAWSIQFAYQGAQKVVQWADQYVQSFAKMDEAMTDVMKYTSQTKQEVEEMNETFKQMTTRTPREELNALAGAAGRLGITARKDIEGFVSAADKINVALGDDLGEGAIDQIGKLTMVFGENKKKGLEGAMLATGSAINVLGASSSANTGFITEFTSAMAGMAVNARISQTDIMGYASALSQAGIEGQTASGVFAQMITKMFTDPAKFAKAAGLEVKSFTELLKTDANQAILQFLDGLKSKGGFDSLAPALKSLSMQGTQAVPVISSLINKMDELRSAQQTAKTAYEEGTSIVDEFNNANSSAAAQLDIAKGRMNDVAVELGQKLMPIVEGSIKTGTAALKIISSLISFVTKYKTVIAALAATIAYYTVASKAATIATAAYTTATNAAKIATIAFNAVLKMNPFGLMIGGLATVVAWLTTYTQKTKEAREAKAELDKQLYNEDGTLKSDPNVKKRNELDEVVVTGTRRNKAAATSPVGESDADGEKNRRERLRRELEAQAKAAWEREKIELRQQYQGRKQMQDEWHDKEFQSEQKYIARLLQIRTEQGAKESDIMEATNMKLDADAREANYREEQRKRRQQESLRNIDRMQGEAEIALARQRLSGEVATQDEYDRRKLELEKKYQQLRVQALTAGSDEYRQAQKRLLALELQEKQQQQSEADAFTNSYQKTNNTLLQQHFTQADSWEEMLRLNDEYRQQDLISEQQYQQNKNAILQAEGDERIRIEQATQQAISNLMQSAQQLFSAMQQREIQQVETKYKKLIADAKKQGKDTTKLEEKMEAEKAEIRKKYAEKQFMMNVLQIVASTAAGIARLWKDLPFYAALPLTAVVAASGAAQLATAKMAADQAAGLYEGGYSDEYQEGYTQQGNPREQAGVIPVHKNEFVANHRAVANPEVRPVLDVIDRHQKAGDIQMLNSTRMLEEAYGSGRYRGGYSRPSAEGYAGVSPADGGASAPKAELSPEVMDILTRIADNTADALTVRELRDRIRREERMEQNARR